MQVIVIGAGPDTDAQILVMHDMLGLYATPPKFAKNFMAAACDVQLADDGLAHILQLCVGVCVGGEGGRVSVTGCQ